jgi:hypothetical protein
VLPSVAEDDVEPIWLSHKPDEMEEGTPPDAMDGACVSCSLLSSGKVKGELPSESASCWLRIGVLK